MMENCCYDRTELMVLNMVRKGLLGELHPRGRRISARFAVREVQQRREGLWRQLHARNRNGDLYPTHGLGPISQCMNINRGNQFVRPRLDGQPVAGPQPLRGKSLWARQPASQETLRSKRRGHTLIQTAAGQTIALTHDTDSPQPFSRNLLIQGTTGLVRKYPEEKIFIDGRSKENEWEALEKYRAEYEHPLWKALVEKAKGWPGTVAWTSWKTIA